MTVPRPTACEVRSEVLEVDGFRTHLLHAGEGPDLVLVHSGEFGASARLSWEYNLAAFAEHFHVVAPDLLGYGESAKVHDFEDFAALKIRHLSRLLEVLGIRDVPFVGNSMGANQLLRDATAAQPMLPASRIVAISGGGPTTEGPARAALVDYDGSIEGMRAVVAALFASKRWPSDPAYVARRHATSLVPGAWECAAAARFRRPQAAEASPGGADPRSRERTAFESITMPVLLIAGSRDVLKPRGYEKDLAASIPGATSVEIDGAGHCAHIERPVEFAEAAMGFLLAE